MRQDRERLIGEAPEFLKLLEAASLAAPLDKPVLIVGERGTGKEGIASRLHYLSNRWEAPLVKLNCAAINESLLENELFGHEAGAFTGASKVHYGRFERAHGGTLFLDELATTSSLVQEKLLRVIEYGEFERVGGSETLLCDVRLIAATNENLPVLAQTGRFRADLLDRLAFDVLTLPPLRYRTADIPLLAEYFALSMTQELERDFFAGFSAEAMSAMMEHTWPGNIRELKNVVERAVYKSDPDAPIDSILFDPFSSPFQPLTTQPAAEAAAKITADAASESAVKSSQPKAPCEQAAFPIELKAEIAEHEKALIEQALQTAKHNQRQAAKLLSLSYHQFRGYLKKYNFVGPNDS